MYHKKKIIAWQIAKIILALSLLLTGPVMTSTAYTRPDSVKIGVLAKRSAERCLEKWNPTAEYL